MIINAEKAVAGRLASKIAKELLKGEKIIVINVEKAVVSGRSDNVVDRYLAKIHRGSPHKGPFYPKYPDRILRRMVRGMIPYKSDKGKTALKSLRVYIGNPENLKGEKITRTSDNLRTKYITLEEISKYLGAKND